MRWFLRLMVVMGALGMAGKVAADVMWTVEAGDLVGASGIEVFVGEFYDVEFVEGTCNSVFDGCTSFQFSTEFAAYVASEALLREVFVDNPEGGPQRPFDSSPSQTAGCWDPLSCSVLTPYAVNTPEILVVGAFNGVNVDDPFFDVLPGDVDFSHDDSRVWARWTVSEPNGVPAPATLLLAALGVAVMGLHARRRCGRFQSP